MPPRRQRRLIACLGALALANAAPPLASVGRADDSPRPRLAADPADAGLLASIPANFREAVAAVVRKPTMTAQSRETPFTASPAVYDWLLDHPDRASLVWKRLDVPCLPITEVAPGRFGWSDANGSNVTWQAVARTPTGVVWLATGRIKPGAVMPLVPVSAVAVVSAPRTALPAPATGESVFEPSVKLYLQTESRAANTLLRIAGPAAPRLAEQGCEQLLLFFSGPARYVRQHPDEAERMLAPASAAKR